MPRRKAKKKKYHRKKIKITLSASVKKGFLIVVGFVLLLLVLLVGFEIWQSARYSLWDGKSHLLVVYQQDAQYGLIRLNPELHEISRLTLPDDLMVNLAEGYQEYRIDKIVDLVEQEDTALGPILSKSMTLFLGSMTEGYIVKVPAQAESIESIFWQVLFKKTTTNLSSWDALRILYYISGLEGGDIQEMSLDSIMKSEKLRDDSVVTVISEPQLDIFALKELADPANLAQSITWEVFNATSNPGLAEQMARVLRNSGFDVVGVRQLPDQIENTQSRIAIHPQVEESVQLQRFSRYFGLPIEKNEEISDTADVSVVLGDEYWQWCCRRSE